MDGATDFREKYEEYANFINNALDSCLATDNKPGAEIYNAMKYSLAAGGKGSGRYWLLPCVKCSEGAGVKSFPLRAL